MFERPARNIAQKSFSSLERSLLSRSMTPPSPRVLWINIPQLRFAHAVLNLAPAATTRGADDDPLPGLHGC